MIRATGMHFVFANNVMTDLNLLIDSPGIHLSAAYAINNLGQILATDGDSNAYILTPIQATSQTSSLLTSRLAPK